MVSHVPLSVTIDLFFCRLLDERAHVLMVLIPRGVRLSYSCLLLSLCRHTQESPSVAVVVKSQGERAPPIARMCTWNERTMKSAGIPATYFSFQSSRKVTVRKVSSTACERSVRFTFPSLSKKISNNLVFCVLFKVWPTVPPSEYLSFSHICHMSGPKARTVRTN